MEIENVLKKDLYVGVNDIDGSAAESFEFNLDDFKTYDAGYKNSPVLKLGAVSYSYAFDDHGYYEQPKLHIYEEYSSLEGYVTVNLSEYYSDLQNAQYFGIALINLNDLSTRLDWQDSFDEFITRQAANGDNWKAHLVWNIGGNIDSAPILIMGDLDTSGIIEIARGQNFAGQTDYIDMSGTFFSNNEDIITIGKIASNVPIFSTLSDAENYVRTGLASQAINYNSESTEETPEDQIHTWRQVLHKCDSNGENDEIVGYTNITVRTSTGSRLAGYVNTYEEGNVRLTFSGTVKKIEYYNGRTTAILDSIADIEGLITWTDQDGHYYKDGNYYYWSKVNKYNWPIESSAEDAQDYVDKKKSSDDVKATPTNRTGNKLEDQTNDNNDSIMRNNLSLVYVLGSSSMKAVANAIYEDSDGDIIKQIKKGLSMYGNNPSEFIIDAYYLPIKVDDFIEGYAKDHIFLGQYQCNLFGGCREVLTNYHMKTMFSTFIYPTFNDFRDYQSNYYLYLPFVGIFELPPSQILNKLLTCKCFFDLRSHNMKYYLFCDNKLLLTKEGSLGVQFPIMSSDFVGKAQQNIQAIENIGNSIIETATNSSPTGVINSAENIFNSTIQLAQKSRVAKSGNSSSATATKDILYCYMIIDNNKYIYPDNLYKTYGMPCNKIAMLGSASGWTVCEDVHLEGQMIPEVRARIEQKLKSGVIF